MIFALCFALLIPAEEPSIVWRYESAIGISSPLILNDMIVFGDDKGTVKALNAETGEERWKSSVGSRVYYAPQTDGEYIAVEMERAGVAVLRASTGEVLWKNPLPKGAGCCYVDGDRKCVFVAGLDGIVYCFDSAKGEEKWKCDVVKEAPKVPKTVRGAQARSDEHDARPEGFARDRDRLFLTIVDQMRVVSLDPDQGVERGHFLTGGWIWTPPALGGGAFLMGSEDKKFYCIDASTCEKRWAIDLGAETNSTPLVVDQEVFVASHAGDLRALDLQTGREKWRFDFKPEGKRGKAVYASPIVNGNEVVFASMEGRLFGVDRSRGGQNWEYRPAANMEIVHGLVERQGVAFLNLQSEHKRGQREWKQMLAAVKLPKSP